MKRNLKFITAILALFLITALPQIVFAQGFTPELVATLKSVTGSVISSDGKYVAYTVSNPADPFKENSANKNLLYILNTTTGETKPYFTSSNVSAVAFRPVKGTVTFLTKGVDDSGNALYEINLNGGEATKIFSTADGILNYTWQNSGIQIAYSVKASAKAPATTLTYKPDFFEEEFATQKGYIVTPGTDKPEPRLINAKGTLYLMSWSADGSKLAISVTPTSSVDDSYMKQQVMVVDAATGNVINTIENEGKLGKIVWSPDGKQLALHSANNINDPTDGSIMLVAATGGKPKNIDPGFLGKYENISWTNGAYIHFWASEGTASLIGTIRADGTGKQILFKSNEHAITGYSVATNGAISFTANSPSHPSELFTIAATKNALPVKRTTSNSWIADLKFGKQEVIKFPARDGKYEIEGILIYPLNYQAGVAVPLITVVHGGPESHYSNGWLTGYSSPGQMGAVDGYAVFYPNYRGSTGRGLDFGYSSQADMAGKEFDDVIDGIDYLISKGIVDKNRVGVTGGSYGGYATAWMSTYYSKRFAAAVMFVGISNNVSLWGTSDIPEEMFLVHARKRLWDNWDGFLKTSPVYYVDRAQTPLLIMHGANDPRVHPGQSLELYRHIKVRKPDLPVRLIYYPGEGHGNSRSGSKYDYNLRMMQWFDTYLNTGNSKAEKPGLDLPTKK
jgi:dipeptidyl aminopeptidase/acylaminoacyl peptidase